MGQISQDLKDALAGRIAALEASLAAAQVVQTNPSGQAPPLGDLPGWQQVFLDDFSTDVASWGTCTTYSGGRDCPSLPAEYRSRWWAYPTSYNDTREKLSGDGGVYTPANISCHDSMLHMTLRRVNGTGQSCAPIPKLPNGDQTYGRYAVRFRAETSAYFKVAWLLWREQQNWGEIDFPEADLDGTISAFNHHSGGGQSGYSTTVPMSGDWHTAVIEWTPGLVRFLLDDVEIGRDTGSNVPSGAMSWVLQSETKLSGSLPADVPDTSILIDWVAVWSYAP